MKRFQYKSRTKKPSGILIFICVCALTVLLFLFGIDSFSEGTKVRQREALERALTRSITYCYAVEGTYPEDLAYLQEHYGLYYDKDRFFVDYHIIGSNIFPDVTIIEKGE